MPPQCSIGSAMARRPRRRIDRGQSQTIAVRDSIVGKSTRALLGAAGFFVCAPNVKWYGTFSSKVCRARLCGEPGLRSREMAAPHRCKTSTFLQRIRNNGPRRSVAPTQHIFIRIKRALSLGSLSVKEEHDTSAELLRFNIRNNRPQLVFLLIRVRGPDA